MIRAGFLGSLPPLSFTTGGCSGTDNCRLSILSVSPESIVWAGTGRKGEKGMKEWSVQPSQSDTRQTRLKVCRTAMEGTEGVFVRTSLNLVGRMLA